MKENVKKTWYDKLSPTSLYHYWKLIGRIVFLLIVVAQYVYCRINDCSFFIPRYRLFLVGKWAVWGVFIVEMILRLFPSNIESMGCQKQFNINFRPVKQLKNLETQGYNETQINDLCAGDRKRGRKTVIAVWVLMNGIIGGLYLGGVIHEGILMIMAMCYSVCDMICILFFCPFQTWFMKNRCCVNCYIYNWDYLMMFTPLIFVKSVYTWSLVAVAFVVFLQWEIRIRITPKRFNRRLNESLACRNCTEKLCRHKKQLQGFILMLEREAKERVDKPMVTEFFDKPFVNEILGHNNEFDVEEEKDEQ